MPRIAVVCEAPADYRTGAHLTDRLLREDAKWLDGELLDHAREWALDADGRPLLWKTIPALAKSFGIRIRGQFGGDPAAPDARAAQRALRVLRRLAYDQGEEIDAVLLLRDADGDPRRRVGLEQARTSAQETVDAPRGATVTPPVIALGVADRMREAWHLAGFLPGDDAERTRLDDERRRLPFDPTREPERLRDSGNNEPRSPKRVLRALTDGDPDREMACLDAPWPELERRGRATGLPEFLQELRERIVPLFAPGPSTG